MTVMLVLVKECSTMKRLRVRRRSVSEVVSRVVTPNTTCSKTHMLHQINVYLRGRGGVSLVVEISSDSCINVCKHVIMDLCKW